MAGGNDDVQNLQATIDDQLNVAVGDSDGVEDNVQVVADKTVSRPLREETQRQQDDKSVAVALGLEEFEPSVAFKFLLQLDCILDLLKFDVHDLGVHITVCVYFSEHSVSLLHLAASNEETRALGHEPHKRDLEEGWKCLHEGRYTPAPVAV